jgi:hypothetical protein
MGSRTLVLRQGHLGGRRGFDVMQTRPVPHESEVLALLAYVGYRGQPGKHLLAVRFSLFDPKTDIGRGAGAACWAPPNWGDRTWWQ